MSDSQYLRNLVESMPRRLVEDVISREGNPTKYSTSKQSSAPNGPFSGPKSISIKRQFTQFICAVSIYLSCTVDLFSHVIFFQTRNFLCIINILLLKFNTGSGKKKLSEPESTQMLSCEYYRLLQLLQQLFILYSMFQGILSPQSGTKQSWARIIHFSMRQHNAACLDPFQHIKFFFYYIMACANELYQCLTLGNASIFSLCVVNVWTRKMACVPSSGVQSPPKSLPSYVARGAVPEGTATQGADADFFFSRLLVQVLLKKIGTTIRAQVN